MHMFCWMSALTLNDRFRNGCIRDSLRDAHVSLDKWTKSKNRVRNYCIRDSIKTTSNEDNLEKLV